MRKKTKEEKKVAGKLLSLGVFEEQENTLSELRSLPKEQKVARALITQAHIAQRSFFDALEKGVADNDGNITYSKLPALISEYDFRAYLIAAKSVLFDQSYICNNDDIITGFNREESNLTTTDGLRDEKGEPYRNGNICVTLNELCRVGYGIPEGQTPQTTQKKNMRKTIEVLDQTPIGIVYANGDIRETYLIKIMAKYKRKADGAETYHLTLNPIFTTQGKGYGLMLRGATTRLTQYLTSKGKAGRGGKSAAHYAFMELLSIQDRKKGEWNISIENLLQHLNLTDMFRKNKKRAIGNLEEIFEAFEAMGFLLERPNPTIPPDGIFHFKLNPDPKSAMYSEEASTPT